MPRIVVDVMPKAEILDPQGKAVTGALARLGHDDVRSVRVGKRFEVEIEGEVSDEALERIRTIAHDVLANTVIEDVVEIRADETASA